MLDIIITAIETLGTVAFALSGVLTAIERRLDLFGAVVLAGTTSVGGGIIRDLILGRTPPQAFVNPYYVAVAFATACIMLLIVRLMGRMTEGRMVNFLMILNVCDAMGLGIFSVLGADAAAQCGYGDNMFLTVFVGVVTGVGGGVLRDLLAGRPPVIMRRDIYALCSIAGTILFFFLRQSLPVTTAMLLCAGFIFVFRLIMLKHKATLPLSGELI
ncbi:MAG: TRIC cation channel family protein [Oscillospiraceae bacterium]|nr:TRIC cation channel family protein [Oscillospiraceae bacterium]